jgi:hypothetical protein
MIARTFGVALGAMALCAMSAAARDKAPVTPLTDDAIAQRAVHEVRVYPRYGIFDNVEIRAHNGTLQLMGEVTQPYKKSDLGKIMSQIPGVVAVDNELKVAPLSTFDDQLRRTVAAALYRDPVLSKYESQPIPAIHIIVDNGHVTLEGVVRTQQDKEMAGIRASQNMGFGMATNNLRVELPNNHG